jgi:L-threonylcarbamoyladenylate synthase
MKNSMKVKLFMSAMQTEIIAIDPVHPEPSIIERAASLLQAGEVVVFPTETVYGLGADALQPAAVERIFAAKGRPFNDPLIGHISNGRMLSELTSSIPMQVKQLAEAFWPGPLTVILPKSPRVPSLVTAGLDTVAIRMPRHPVALALIRAVGSPIAAPSANRFMHVSPTTAQHVFADLHGRVQLILDGGPTEVGVESTVLDLCSPVPTILRPGGISLEALRSVLPDVQLASHRKSASKSDETAVEANKSPGQMLIHYAPTTPLILYEGPVDAMRAAMLAQVEQRRAMAEQVGVLIADEDLPVFQDSGALVQSLGNSANVEQIASSLFAAMRALEEAGVQVILCRSFDVSGLGLAVHDRLLRAASERVAV